MRKTIERVIGCILFEAAGLSLTFILWYLQENRPQGKDEPDYTLLWGGLTFSVMLIINTVIIIRKEVLYKHRVIEDWSSMLLQHIIDDHLGGENYTVRASIYRPIGFLGALTRYLSGKWHIFTPHWWSNMPHDRNATYLYMYRRKSTIQEKAKGTIIKATTKDEKANGVVDYCYKYKNEHSPVYKTTASIKDITDLSEKKLLTNHDLTDRLMAYMKGTLIESEDINLLRSMNTHPHILYAIKITDNKEDIWGVLVIDTDDVNYKKSIEEEMSGVYSHYSKLFKNLFNSL